MRFVPRSVILKAQKIDTAKIPFSENLEPKEDNSIIKIYTKKRTKFIRKLN